MITKVIPTIKDDCKMIIQQDRGGASAHHSIEGNDADFFAAAVRTGLLNTKLELQQPKLPDVNMLDLSFFWAL